MDQTAYDDQIDAAHREAVATFERQARTDRRYRVTPRLLAFLFGTLRQHDPEPCRHMRPDAPQPRFTTLAVPGRAVCIRCWPGLLLSVPVGRDDLCDRCGNTEPGVVPQLCLAGALAIQFRVCADCAAQLGVTA